MTARQIAKVQSADANANEPFNVVADFIKHSADLAINSLPQDDPQPSRFDGVNFLETRALAIERQSLK